MRKHLWFSLGVAGLFLLLVACRSDTRDIPAATNPLRVALSPSVAPPTLTLPAVRATLPPTWTRTFSPTPLPTRTPTMTPLPPSTLTSAQVCNVFQAVSAPLENSQFDFDATISFGWSSVPAD